MEGDSGFPSPAIIDESSREALEVLQQICTNYSIFNQNFFLSGLKDKNWT